MMRHITTYSYRAKGFVKTARYKLGYIQMQRNGNRIEYHCKECNKTFPKRSILIHYSTLPEHREIYTTLVRLLTIWGLVESEQEPDIEPTENLIELTN